jgi:Ulp1 family protease
MTEKTMEGYDSMRGKGELEKQKKLKDFNTLTKYILQLIQLKEDIDSRSCSKDEEILWSYILHDDIPQQQNGQVRILIYSYWFHFK